MTPGENALIDGLVDVLPPVGAMWPAEQKRLWLETAERVLQMIYSELETIPAKNQ